MAYNGADALAELVEHDPSVVVGILGGAAGTTRDTFELLHRASSTAAGSRCSGARSSARSRSSTSWPDAPVLRGELDPADAVRAYHEALAKAGLPPGGRWRPTSR